MLATYTQPAPSYLGRTGDVLRACSEPLSPDEEAYERFEDDGGPSAPDED